MTAVHILVKHSHRYLKYAAICCESLISRGQVPPHLIIVSVVGEANDSPAMEALRSLGVNVQPYSPEYGSKFIWVDRTFKLYPHFTRIIQLDADTVLTEDMDFLASYSTFDNDYSTYENPGEGKKILKNRSALFFDGFKHGRSAEERARLDAFLMALVGTNMAEVEQRADRWIFGGLIVIKRSVLGSFVWNAILALSRVCVCDESILQFTARPFANCGIIAQERIPHRVNPEVMDFDSGPGMIHYAGEWYRLDNLANRAALEARFTLKFPHVCA